MAKQLIATTILLLIHNNSEVIQYVQTILHFIILAQYISYKDQTLSYIEHALYRFEKTKIVFE